MNPFYQSQIGDCVQPIRTFAVVPPLFRRHLTFWQAGQVRIRTVPITRRHFYSIHRIFAVYVRECWYNSYIIILPLAEDTIDRPPCLYYFPAVNRMLQGTEGCFLEWHGDTPTPLPTKPQPVNNAPLPPFPICQAVARLAPLSAAGGAQGGAWERAAFLGRISTIEAFKVGLLAQPGSDCRARKSHKPRWLRADSGARTTVCRPA